MSKAPNAAIMEESTEDEQKLREVIVTLDGIWRSTVVLSRVLDIIITKGILRTKK